MIIVFLQVERLEARVVTPLKAYGNIVKVKRVRTHLPLPLTACDLMSQADKLVPYVVTSKQ